MTLVNVTSHLQRQIFCGTNSLLSVQHHTILLSEHNTHL